jgi:hypothetical protein
MRKMLCTALQLQGNMRDNVEYNSSLRFSKDLRKNLIFRQHINIL